jgi:hypothetical protein
MALFNDADFISSADLLIIDPEVPIVAKANHIQLDTPQGICAMACDEVGQKLLSETQAFQGFLPPFATPYTQTAAVINLVGPAVNRSRIPLSQIVVSSPTDATLSSLKRFAVYTALELVYRAAVYSKVNDRYQKKREDFQNEIRKKYWPRLYNQGCPVVFKPLAAPGALHEFQAGVWSTANLAAVGGTNALVTANYDVAITWVDQSLYQNPANKYNAESGGSALAAAFSLPTANVLQVSIAGLNPPNGQAPINVALGQGIVVPGNATGWNLYVGQSGSTLYLQNATPIPIATQLYTMPGAPVLSGYTLLQGQYPDQYLTMARMIMRG